jgi:hypothetical protein
VQVGDLVMWQGAPRTAKPMLVAEVKAPGGIPWLVKLWNPEAPDTLWHPAESLELHHASR